MILFIIDVAAGTRYLSHFLHLFHVGESLRCGVESIGRILFQELLLGALIGEIALVHVPYSMGA